MCVCVDGVGSVAILLLSIDDLRAHHFKLKKFYHTYRIAENFCEHKFSRITNKHTLRKKVRDF